MRRIGVVLLVVCAGVLAANTAAAQERGHTGLAMGIPASLSVIWHATDRFALRPEFTVTKASSESTTTSGTTTSTDALGVGFAISALYYLAKTDNLSTYVSPRFSYSRNTVDAETDSTFALFPRTETTARSIGLAGAFGAQYAVSRRFGVFGEVGVQWSDQHAEADTTDAESNGWTFAPRTAVGVILYF